MWSCAQFANTGRLLSTALLSDSIFSMKFYAFILLEIQPVKGCEAETGALKLTQFLSSARGLPVLSPVSGGCWLDTSPPTGAGWTFLPPWEEAGSCSGFL